MQLSFLPIYKREMRAYFQNAGVYVTAAVFLGVAGLFTAGHVKAFAEFCQSRMDPMQMQMYGMQKVSFTESVVRPNFYLIHFFFLIVVPLLTMRLFAEEKKSGTFELIATCPVTDWGLVIGKFLAAFTVIVILLIASLVMPISMTFMGKVEIPAILTAYLALVLIGLCYAAFGTFASSLTENQIVAGVITFFGLLAFTVIGYFGEGNTELWGELCRAVSLDTHMENLVTGKIRSEDIVYFVAFTLCFLFLTNHILESRRRRV